MAGCILSPAINVSYSDGITNVWEVAFDKFTGTPRSYVQNSTLSFSLAGASILSGNTRANRYTWAIAAYSDAETAHQLDEIYRYWDLARSNSQEAVLGVTDQTFVRDIAQPVTATAVFTSAPTFDKRDSNLWVVSFGMTEV